MLLAQQDDIMKLSLAQSYEQAGDYGNAVKLYESLYQTNPQNLQYLSSLYRVYTQLKNYAAAVDILEKRIKDAPDDVSAYGMLGAAYHRMGNETKAYEIWELPLKKFDPNAITYRVIADYVLERRDFQKAIDLYERGRTASADKNIFSYDLARLYVLTMQFAKAAEEYCTILINDPGQLSAVEIKIFEYISKPAALDETLKIVEDYANDENLSLQFLLARLYTEKKFFDKAFELYLEIDRLQSGSGNELFRYADLLLQENQFDLSSEVYKKIIGLYPESPQLARAKLGYARSLEAELFSDYEKTLPLWKPYFPMLGYESGKITGVLSAFDEIVKLYEHTEPAYEALLRSGIINFYLRKDIEESKRLLNIIMKESPLSPAAAEAHFELGSIALMQGNLEEAEKIITELSNSSRLQFNKKNSALYKLARICFYQSKLDKARDILSGVLTNLKDNSANDALELSLILNSSMNDSINISRFAEAEFLAEQQKFSEAAMIYKSISENPQAFVLHSISLLRLGEMKLADDNYPEAVSTFENIAAEGIKNIYADKAVYLLGKIHQFGINDKVKAEEYYQKLLTDYPDSIYADDARQQLKILMKNSS